MFWYLMRRLSLLAIAAGVIGAGASLLPDSHTDQSADRFSRPPVTIWPGDPSV